MEKQEAVKFDTGKPPITMVSREVIEGMARVRAFGAKKYSRDNWKNGFTYTRSLDAAFRHLLAFNDGEDLDPESGESHLYHAMCSIEHVAFTKENLDESFDDRFKKKAKVVSKVEKVEEKKEEVIEKKEKIDPKQTLLKKIIATADKACEALDCSKLYVTNDVLLVTFYPMIIRETMSFPNIHLPPVFIHKQIAIGLLSILLHTPIKVRVGIIYNDRGENAENLIDILYEVSTKKMFEMDFSMNGTHRVLQSRNHLIMCVHQSSINQALIDQRIFI